ncbi:MAG: ferrous iron transport protein A [Clostridiales bacterium]|nr:ferrous iron transport protein A [Clostridiales bacterium]
MHLGQLKAGHKGVICQVFGKGELRRRLLDMGLTPGTMVEVRKRAPIGDPIEIFVRNYCLTIRLTEARNIVIQER